MQKNYPPRKKNNKRARKRAAAQKKQQQEKARIAAQRQHEHARLAAALEQKQKQADKLTVQQRKRHAREYVGRHGKPISLKREMRTHWKKLATVAAAVSVLGITLFLTPNGAQMTAGQAPPMEEAPAQTRTPRQQMAVPETGAPQAGATPTAEGGETTRPAREKTDAPVEAEETRPAASQPVAAEAAVTPAAETTTAPAAQAAAAPVEEATTAPAAEEAQQPETQPIRQLAEEPAVSIDSARETPAVQESRPAAAQATESPSASPVAGDAAEPGQTPAETAPAPVGSGLPIGNAVASPFDETLFTGDMADGSRDALVPMVEQRLAELGYMAADETPGLYDQATVQAVGYFQRGHGIPQTGAADLGTTRMLMSQAARPYAIEQGAVGDDVRMMQVALSAMRYDTAVDGTFGEGTGQAVSAFQRNNGMLETGTVGAQMRDLLLSGGGLRADGTVQAAGVNMVVEALIAVAEDQLGDTYSLGSKGPNAFDCSGLVYYCLNASGTSIGYMTSGDWPGSGYQTINSMGDLERGDIVCFKGHVGIYLGDGQMIDASSSQGKVRHCYDIQSDGYWTSNFICGKRVL